MKTRRQRNGKQTKRGGFYSQLSAIAGNVANGGGRIAQVNEIFNLGTKEEFRQLKRSLIVLSSAKINDPRFKHLHVLPDDPESTAEKPVDKETLEKVTEETAKAVEKANDEDSKKKENTEEQPAMGGTRKNKRNRI